MSRSRFDSHIPVIPFHRHWHCDSFTVSLLFELYFNHDASFVCDRRVLVSGLHDFGVDRSCVRTEFPSDSS